MYSDLDDITERIPERIVRQLTDDDNLGVISQGKVDAVIERADRLIDSYCGGRYAVPFGSPPAVVREISATIAVYYLYGRKAEKIPEAREEAYRDAVARLKDIAKGLISLGAEQPPEASSQSDLPDHKSADFVFSDDNLENF